MRVFKSWQNAFAHTSNVALEHDSQRCKLASITNEFSLISLLFNVIQRFAFIILGGSQHTTKIKVSFWSGIHLVKAFWIMWKLATVIRKHEKFTSSGYTYEHMGFTNIYGKWLRPTYKNNQITEYLCSVCSEQIHYTHDAITLWTHYSLTLCGETNNKLKRKSLSGKALHKRGYWQLSSFIATDEIVNTSK